VTRNTPPPNQDEEDNAGLLALAASGLVVGALTGLVGSAFHLALDGARQLRLVLLAWTHAYPDVGWLAPVLLAAIFAYVARWLVGRFAPQASGSGVQEVEAVIRGEAAPMRGVVLPVKLVGGVLALGSGMALGQEGPKVQMGATIGHLWSQLFRLRAGEGRALLAAGAGAGLAAAFNAPLAGAIFVFEELLRRFELRVAIATLSACSAGLVVMRMLIGDRLGFSVPPVVVSLFPGYFFFLLLGAVIGVLGVLYSRMVVAGLDAADRARHLRPEVQAAIVGAIVGFVAWVADDAIGSGEHQVQAVFDGGHTFALIGIVFLVRLVLGPLCYAPGLPGGLFAPLLVIGSFAGVLLGKAMETLVPGFVPPLPVIAAVGMGRCSRRSCVRL